MSTVRGIPEVGGTDWFYGDRFYLVGIIAIVSPFDGWEFELDDVAPAPGRGSVLTVVWDEDACRLSFQAHTSSRLPLALVERFLALVSQELEQLGATVPDRPRPRDIG